MRSRKKYSITNIQPNLGELGDQQVLYLNSNKAGQRHLLALGLYRDFSFGYSGNSQQIFQELQQLKDWRFGYISYDYKNELEQLFSENFDGIGFPKIHFWQPKIVFVWMANELEAHYLGYSESEVDQLVELIFKSVTEPDFISVALSPRFTKQSYFKRFKALQSHINQGDIYEVNFCQEFFAENAKLFPWAAYVRLNELTQAPYSAFLRDEQRYLMCASPEQFLKKHGDTLVTSPIKGTIKRASDKVFDEELKQQLATSEKEQAENVMIVDLVRNDLAKIAAKSSVKVEALFEVNTFKTVHQLVSKVSCKLAPETTFFEIIKATFPMGSMTGAPKISAMQLAEQYETTKRGLYSGTVGYLDPTGDFEFNVVIRSLQYNAQNNYLSLMVGGAITTQANADDEYNECLLKAEALLNSLQAQA